ncbi:hypothetical protein GGQ92_001511 [Gracilibacillus halotolerans]|uniref:Haem-binding uptake Tiki superfamily ChaN domain-containing protein n=1 Tax=Gracilibacillus halotolerans TaxID=74386 RepID=A0A841RNH5_9BACI|nr:DUF5694 domain-containing protein [Gracilibacillus halotolerans]MBB6512725.1 hypothetical protein [Gracilibacillus halotolerans]
MDRKPTILVLGTDHLDNPNNGDMFMSETEDILNINRQIEINQVINSLREFNPTKIALEVLTNNQSKLNHDYQSYLNGNFELTSNERHQFGFQLAKVMNLRELFAVDWNESIEGVPDLGSILAANKSDLFDEVAEKGKQVTLKTENYFKKHTIKEFLLWLNDEENVKSNHEIYMKLALVGSKNKPIGSMWVAQYWYYRNMVIYKNIVELIDSNEDRILVLYGAGHLKLLNQFFLDSNIFDVEKVQDYL